ncbi:hypothetical protein ACGFMM_24815 [Streptomyces sp. NPDC048604]
MISRTAHMRPADAAGFEWTTDKPEALRPAGPVIPETHPKTAR